MSSCSSPVADRPAENSNPTLPPFLSIKEKDGDGKAITIGTGPVEFKVNEKAYEAYHGYNWAIFPTLSCLEKYIKGLEELRRQSVDTTQNKIENILKLKSESEGEEFTYLMKKGYQPDGGTSGPLGTFRLPINPKIDWKSGMDRYVKVMKSWEEDSPQYEGAKRQIAAAYWLDILGNLRTKYRKWDFFKALRPPFLSQSPDVSPSEEYTSSRPSSAADHPVENSDSPPFLIPSGTQDPKVIEFGYKVRTQRVPDNNALKRALTVNEEVYNDYINGKWAIFPTFSYLEKYIIGLETKQGIPDFGSKGNEEFTYLIKKGDQPDGGISGLIFGTCRLQIDPKFVRMSEMDRYMEVAESWKGTPHYEGATRQIAAAYWLDILEDSGNYEDSECDFWKALRPLFLPQPQDVSPSESTP